MKIGLNWAIVRPMLPNDQKRKQKKEKKSVLDYIALYAI